ncbi:PepSY domain-containing protein [Amaricoccus sp.]|uniref:PepSY-associated TM helix domain-containing protein n=1 Tax=Amaricoccus sp. TaxID=1872485 RepID=UPI001B5052F5|nr:PepSY-associated TM helix domain-containing protein [Amaricoccus sp.]MBP7001366.1 PepSY domain-containing protein [Amaricoccus sp.]
MLDLSQARLKRLTAIHGWSAVVLGLLLYAVIATGAVAVFGGEIGRWSAGGVRVAEPLEGPVDARVRKLAREVDPEYLHDISFWGGEGDDLHVFYHTHAINPDTGEEDDLGTMFRVTADGTVLERHDGFIWWQPESWEASALRNFLIDLHVQLYLPDPWGLILTGILGLMMMAAVVSGVLMHRHLIRDLFVAERPGGRLSSVRDRHVLSGSWSIPFGFLLAFTGSFFSFAGTVSFPLVAAVAFHGDEKAMSETLFERPAPEDPTPAPLASLDYIIADSIARAGSPATSVGIENYGRADARVNVWHNPRDGGMLYVNNVYDGPTRRHLGENAPIGTERSAGGVLYGLMAPLHFGHFAGMLSKAVWGALGVAMCFVILSGFRLWVRRRADQPQWRRFGHVVQVFGYGLPIGMLASGVAFFVARPLADPFLWTPLGFLAGAVLAVAIGWREPDEDRLGRSYQRLIGAICLLLPVLRIAMGGMDWAEAMLHGQRDVLTVDMLLLIAGAYLLLHARGRAPARARRLRPEPAE